MHYALDVRLTYYTQGGISKYIQRLAERLPALAPHARHTHAYRRGHTAQFSPLAHRLTCWTPAHHRLERWALSVEAARLWPDIWHAPDFIPPQTGYRHAIITVHDVAFLRYPEFLTAASRRYYNAQIGWAVRHARAICADSHATARDLQELLRVPAEKIHVIHLGREPEFAPLPPEAVAPVLARYALPRDYILFVGTFEPRKNVVGLLGAYFRLRQRRPSAPPLVLVGRKGWLFGAVAEVLNELNLADQVRFLEDVPQAELPALYNGAGALALVSHYEGFGFPVLEALACGTPVVYAQRASLPEIAGPAGLAVNPDDLDDISHALERALTDEALRADLRAAGLAQAQRFDWDETARHTLAVYAQVMGV